MNNTSRTTILFAIGIFIVASALIISLSKPPYPFWTTIAPLLAMLVSAAVTIGTIYIAALFPPNTDLATSAPIVTNFNQALQTANLDESVGIAHAALAGTDDFRLHITKLLPGAKVKAHRHGEGDELYIINSGSGHLYTGRSLETGVEEWFDAVAVEAGATFTVSPGMLHQLHNTGDAPLILIFGCPDSHLASDRVVVADCPLAATAATA